MLIRAGDRPAPGELADVIAEAQRQIEAEHTPPRLKRDAHPKMHGCLLATLEVCRDISATGKRQFAHGVFAEGGRTYRAWVRFSNAFRIQHDLEVETRGMAVKLLDITDGDPLPDAETVVVRESPERRRYTQDFLFATHDAFFLPDPTEYFDFLKAARKAPLGIAAFYRDRWPRLHAGFVALVLSQLRGATFNPLSVRYFSQTPYRLGSKDNIVKFRMRPVKAPHPRWYRYPGWWLILVLANFVFFVLEPLTKRGKAWAENVCDRHFVNRDFLRFAMMDTLASREATFVLEAQARNAHDEVENACRRWTGKFTPIATLRIPSQTFWPQAGLPPKVADAASQLVTLGENMSFNPWHGLKAHTPVGSINEARRWIYRDIARFRRDGNHVDPCRIVVRQREAWNELRPFIQFGQVS